MREPTEIDALMETVKGVKAAAEQRLSERERMKAALEQIKEESIDPHASRIAERALDEK